MKSIMIDMDDVICSGGFLHHLNKFLDSNYQAADIKDYYLEDIVPSDKVKAWNDYICTQNLYKEGNVFFPDAIEVIERLTKKYEVYIVTAYVWRDNPTKSGDHLYNKFECLCKNLNFLRPEHFVFCNDKHLIKTDIKIDDKLINIMENCDTKLLFDAYHNRDISDIELKEKGVIRVCTWRQIGALLLDEKYREDD